MTVKEALFARRSIRSFAKEAISEEDIETLLHAAMSGPSAVNKKPWEFYVVKDPEKIAQLNKVGFANYSCPLVIVVAGNRDRFLPVVSEFWVQDVSAATENILLEATELGLGSVWCGVYPNKARSLQVRQILGAGLNIVPFNIICLGHPAGEIPAPRDQYEAEKVHFE
jgi:nitroreductase